MKTKIITIVAMLMLNLTLAFSNNPESNLLQSVSEQINLPYPAFAVDKQLEGAVYVEFTITDDKEIQVINCNSLVGELQSYVYEKMSGMKVVIDPKMADKTYLKTVMVNGVEFIIVADTDVIGKTFLMRFDFVLE